MSYLKCCLEFLTLLSVCVNRVFFCQLVQVIYEDLPANLCAIRDRVELLESNTSQDSRNGTNEPENTDNQELPDPKEPGSIPLEDASKEDDKPVRKMTSSRRVSPRIRKKPLVAGLQRDFNILERELLKFIAEQVSSHNVRLETSFA